MEKILALLAKMPKGCRIVCTALLAALIGVAIFFSSTSCSSVKAVSYGNGSIRTSVSQSGADSVNVSVNLYPKN